MEFSPFNKVVKLCLQGMEMEERNMLEKAMGLFQQAWQEASNDFEKYLAAYFIARLQEKSVDKLRWLETALACARRADNVAVKSAFPTLYSSIGKCFEDLNDPEKAKENYERAAFFQRNPSDEGPFYHGTKADLQVDDFLTAGGDSNYKSGVQMNHIYFTGMANGAGLAAALAKGDGEERVYVVEPTGSFENDPNVTDKKFPGNPTRAYRSKSPLKIVGEVKDWVRPSPQELEKFRTKLEDNKGDIIN